MSLPAPSPDRAALVTGASSGIGADLARQLAGRGHGVVLVARREDELKSLGAELAARHGIRAEVLPADLADAEARRALPSRVQDLGLTVDVLVNNAGVSTLGLVQAAEREAELRMVRVDVEAVVDLCTLFLPGMVARRSGAILNVASTAAFQPLPGQAGYAAAKAFVLSYTEALAAELAGSGVSVTALCPGPVKTGFGRAAGFTPEEEESSLPGILWLSASEVARQGVAGLDRGRPVVVAGRINAALATMARHAPRRLILSVVSRSHPGMKRRDPVGTGPRSGS